MVSSSKIGENKDEWMKLLQDIDNHLEIYLKDNAAKEKDKAKDNYNNE